MKTLLQEWWDETYPKAGVKEVRYLDNFTIEMALAFSEWVSNKKATRY